MIRSHSFLVEYSGFFLYKTMSKKNVISNRQSYFFLSNSDLFFLPVSLARIYRTMFNRSDENGHFCCSWFRRKTFILPHCIWYYLWAGHIGPFLCWEIFLWCLIAKSFIMNPFWILWNDFSSSIEIIIWFLAFLSLIWCIMMIDLQILNHLATQE